jgi:hypothetical protein
MRRRFLFIGLSACLTAGWPASPQGAQAPASGGATAQAGGSKSEAPTSEARSLKPEARNWNPPKTAWGDPDIQGFYTNKDESGIPFERPGDLAGKRLEDIEDQELAELIKERQQQTASRAAGIGGADTGAGPVHWYENYGAKNSQAWLVIDPADGRIPPMTPEAQARVAAMPPARTSFTGGPWDGPEDFSLYDRCITRGLPGSMMPAIYGNSYQIVQSPGYVAIRYEMIHEARVIPLDGRPHLTQSIRPFMGDARGRWDGKTLIVETTNFNPRTTYRNGNSETFRMIERFTPVGPNTMAWSVTIDDPKTWTRPWTFAMNLTKDETQPPFEYACHEGNYGMPNILRGARATEEGGK